MGSRWEETNFVSRFRIQGPNVMRSIIIMRGPRNGATHGTHFISLDQGSQESSVSRHSLFARLM